MPSGAAVVPVLTTNGLRESKGSTPRPGSPSETRDTYVGDGAAAPSARLLHEAAAGVSRAAGLAVTRDLGRPGSQPTGLLPPGRNLPQPRPGLPAGHVAGLTRQVTPVAFRTAVLAVAAAHGLGRGGGTSVLQNS